MHILRFLISVLLLINISACSKKDQSQTSEGKAEDQQHDMAAETSSDVPELWEFHEVIYQIWHEAWPEKNTQLLTDLIPEIEAGFAKLEQAELPGILRDKQEAWTKGIKEMAAIIETYKQTAAQDQKEALLKAAEDLHSKFEQLVRLIRPVMKEIDQFHQELYMIYHYYMPDYDLEKIKSSANELVVRAEAIDLGFASEGTVGVDLDATGGESRIVLDRKAGLLVDASRPRDLVHILGRVEEGAVDGVHDVVEAVTTEVRDELLAFRNAEVNAPECPVGSEVKLDAAQLDNGPGWIHGRWAGPLDGGCVCRESGRFSGAGEPSNLSCLSKQRSTFAGPARRCAQPRPLAGNFGRRVQGPAGEAS